MKNLVFLTAVTIVFILAAFFFFSLTPFFSSRVFPFFFSNYFDNVRLEVHEAAGQDFVFPAEIVFRSIRLRLGSENRDYEIVAEKLGVPDFKDFFGKKGPLHLVVTNGEIATDDGGILIPEGRFCLTVDKGKISRGESVFRRGRVRIPRLEMIAVSGSLRQEAGTITLDALSARVFGADCSGRLAIDTTPPVHYTIHLDFPAVRPVDFEGLLDLLASLTGTGKAVLDFSGTRKDIDQFSFYLTLPADSRLSHDFIGIWKGHVIQNEDRNKLEKIYAKQDSLPVDLARFYLQDTGNGHPSLLVDIIARKEDIFIQETIPLKKQLPMDSGMVFPNQYTF